jgi:2-octaprenylphenol hydroxylase
MTADTGVVITGVVDTAVLDTTVVDIAIVGGGMAGTALACALARSGYRLALIESQAPTAFDPAQFFDPRVVALNAASHHFLDSLGAWAHMAQHRLSPYEHMQVWDADGTADITFDCHDIQQTMLGHIVENSLVVHGLQQALHAHTQHSAGSLSIFCPDTVIALTDNDAQHHACTLQLSSGRRVQATLVVAADGAVSALRQLADIPVAEHDYGHTAVIATVRTEHRHDRTARQRFLTDGPLAFLPLRTDEGDEHWCSVVWSMPPEQADSVMAMTDNDFATALGKAFEHRAGTIQEVKGRHAFPLRQRHAHSYHCEHVVLIGDAAHTIHPLAGQGVNLGFMDVQVLAEELVTARERGLSPADPVVLKRYQRRRRGANFAMSATMQVFHKLFARRELPVRWLRNTGLRSVDKLPLLKRELMRQAMGL